MLPLNARANTKNRSNKINGQIEKLFDYFALIFKNANARPLLVSLSLAVFYTIKIAGDSRIILGLLDFTESMQTTWPPPAAPPAPPARPHFGPIICASKMFSFLKGAARESLTAPICDWLWIGKSIHTTFTDWGYLDLATAVNLLLTNPNLTAVATLN